MTMVSKKRPGFRSSPVYRKKEPHAFQYLSERATFWVAVFSVLAFVTGNMLGQHGWRVFWASVLGNNDDSTIQFTGMVPPMAAIPDYAKWGKLGGSARDHTFREVPMDLLIPLPAYDPRTLDTPEMENLYIVDQLGTYKTGRGEGSHPGVDIVVPVGTPVQSVANGIVMKASVDSGGYGNYIMIKHPNAPDPDNPAKLTTLYSIYAHLSVMLVREGDVVDKGEQIGASGVTGFASGPHLHFQMDRAEAPWHPYWPFSGEEARRAKLTMAQAVDSGLGRARGLLYTTNPLLYVQSHPSSVGTTVARASSSSSVAASSKAPTLASRMADRLKARLAKIQTSGTPVALTTSASASSAARVIVSTQTVALAESVLPEASREVVAARIEHDRSFSAERELKTVRITLIGVDGSAVTNPRLERGLQLRTAYGRAEFTPPTLIAADFKNGVATVKMLPLGQQTVVVQIQPLGVIGQPMGYQK